MVNRGFSYFFILLFILVQGIILVILFNKSIQIDGDIISYLKIMAGDLNSEFDVEPLSLLIFKTIGIFPTQLHLTFLTLFIYLLCIVESWIIFKKTNGSLLWILFFTFAVIPFFHAINLRTGFGMFFLLLFYEYSWSIIFVPFFHASFFPLLIGIKFKLSFRAILSVLILSIVLGLVLYSLVFVKLETYFGYYNEDGSTLGVLLEIFALTFFSFFLAKKYKLKSHILWYRILFSVLVIACASYKIAIISSRYVTLAYLIILIIRLSSNEIKKNNNWTINNFLFFLSFSILISFRIYRVVTMFGFDI